MRNGNMVRGATLVAFFSAVAASARAAAPAADAQSVDLARLQAEVREQRQLIMQLMRVEKEHYDLLLRLIQEQRGVEGGLPPVAPPTTAPAGTPAAGDTLPLPPASPPPRPATATVRGKVQFPGGRLEDVYAFVENVKSPPVRGKTVEIAQRDKRFVPEVLVVQRGTRVLFPNYDTVFHNVFSPTQPHPFDLGSYRAGEEPKAVEMASPGVVEVFCNMHAAMRASVVVVPSSVYTRVGADGSFHLDGVPVGKRKIVIWGPRSKPAAQTVDLAASGADVTVTLEPQAEGSHNNKYGQPYGSYPSKP